MTFSLPNPIGKAVVVGGGIGGVQCALDLADTGFYVYLLEHSHSLGGIMARLDKTFPTNDCSTCMFSPKLVQIAGHPGCLAGLRCKLKCAPVILMPKGVFLAASVRKNALRRYRIRSMGNWPCARRPF